MLWAQRQLVPVLTLHTAPLKPYQGVQPATLAKWLLQCMDRAGICTKSYRTNSIRSAGASSLRSKGLSLAQVLKRGNWSQSTRTFSIFYDRSGVINSGTQQFEDQTVSISSFFQCPDEMTLSVPLLGEWLVCWFLRVARGFDTGDHSYKFLIYLFI